jgi:hypothetical protein
MTDLSMPQQQESAIDKFKSGQLEHEPWIWGNRQGHRQNGAVNPLRATESHSTSNSDQSFSSLIGASLHPQHSEAFSFFHLQVVRGRHVSSVPLWCLDDRLRGGRLVYVPTTSSESFGRSDS